MAAEAAAAATAGKGKSKAPAKPNPEDVPKRRKIGKSPVEEENKLVSEPPPAEPARPRKSKTHVFEEPPAKIAKGWPPIFHSILVLVAASFRNSRSYAWAIYRQAIP